MCNRLGVCQRFIGNFFFFAHLAPSFRSNHQNTLLGFYSMTPPCFYDLLRAAFLISVQWLPHFSYCCIKAVNTGCMHSLADQKILHSIRLNLKTKIGLRYWRIQMKLFYVTSSFWVFCCISNSNMVVDY